MPHTAVIVSATSPSSPAEPTPEAAAWLDALPVAVVVLDGQPAVTWANATARSWLGALGEPGAAWPGHLLPATDADAPVALDARRWVRVRAAEGGGPGLRLVLEDATADMRARQARAQDAVALGLIRHVGRIGIWSRDTSGQRGAWDPQVFGFWGVPQSAGALDLGEATARIVDEDRDGLVRCYESSKAQPGMHDHRYRVRRPDGSVAHLHSYWHVPDGPGDGEITGPNRLIPSTRITGMPTSSPTAAALTCSTSRRTSPWPARRRRTAGAMSRQFVAPPLLCIVEARSRDIVAFLDRLVADGVLDVRVGSDPR